MDEEPQNEFDAADEATPAVHDDARENTLAESTASPLPRETKSRIKYFAGCFCFCFACALFGGLGLAVYSCEKASKIAEGVFSVVKEEHTARISVRSEFKASHGVFEIVLAQIEYAHKETFSESETWKKWGVKAPFAFEGTIDIDADVIFEYALESADALIEAKQGDAPDALNFKFNFGPLTLKEPNVIMKKHPMRKDSWSASVNAKLDRYFESGMRAELRKTGTAHNNMALAQLQAEDGAKIYARKILKYMGFKDSQIGGIQIAFGGAPSEKGAFELKIPSEVFGK